MEALATKLILNLNYLTYCLIIIRLGVGQSAGFEPALPLLSVVLPELITIRCVDGGKRDDGT